MRKQNFTKQSQFSTGLVGSKARSLNDDPRRGLLRSRADLLPNPRRDLFVELGMRAVGLRDDDRRSRIRGLADGYIERHLAEEFDAELLGLFPGAAMAEDFASLAAMRAEEVAHVLDEAQHRHVDLLEHVEALARVLQGDVLRASRR